MRHIELDSLELQLNSHFEKAEQLAEQIVIERAKRILKSHPNLDEFLIAMGGWFFTRKVVDERGNKIIHEPFAYMKPLENFIDKWNHSLHLTGLTLRFTAEGPLKRDW